LQQHATPIDTVLLAAGAITDTTPAVKPSAHLSQGQATQFMSSGQDKIFGWRKRQFQKGAPY
jgi:hypothetical protein